MAVALVAGAYAVGLAVPATRRLFLDARHRVGAARAARRALLAVPLGVVVLEEVAFRGVLWGLVEVEHGAAWATAVSSVLFGLWHVLPAVDGARANAEGEPVGRGAIARQVVATVAFTTGAGVVFAVLRQRERQPARAVPPALGDQRAGHPRRGVGVGGAPGLTPAPALSPP